MKKKKRNNFSIEQKEQVVQTILKGMESYHSVGRKLNTSHKLVSLWVDSYKAHGRSGLSFKNDLSYTGEFKLGFAEKVL